MVLRRERYRKAQQKHIDILTKQRRMKPSMITGKYYITFITASDYTKLCNEERRMLMR